MLPVIMLSYVCMCVLLCVIVHLYVVLCVCVRLWVCEWVWVFVCVWVVVCMFGFECLYVVWCLFVVCCVCVWLLWCVCVYVCVCCVCVCVCQWWFFCVCLRNIMLIFLKYRVNKISLCTWCIQYNRKMHRDFWSLRITKNLRHLRNLGTASLSWNFTNIKITNIYSCRNIESNLKIKKIVRTVIFKFLPLTLKLQDL